MCRRTAGGLIASLRLVSVLAVVGICGPSLAQVPPVDPQTQAKASKLVAELVARFEKFVFRDDETVPVDFDPKREFHYMLLGYAGDGTAFDEFLFNAPFLSYAKLDRLRVNITDDPKSADIIAVLTDTGPENDNVRWLISKVTGIDADTEHHDAVLFSGECYLSQLFIDHHLARTIVAINVLRVKNWPGSGDQKSGDAIIPGACLAAGITSHLGRELSP
jgi:hypothetical protein